MEMLIKEVGVFESEYFNTQVLNAVVTLSTIFLSVSRVIFTAALDRVYNLH
jgi:hypothetical protein